jgi:hypothetical protein
MMRHRIKGSLVSVVVTVVAVLSIGAVTASANRFSIDDQDFRGVFPAFTAIVEGVGQVECPLTLAGSFHGSTLAKTVGGLIGFITSARFGERCTGGGMTILAASLPWHLLYAGFGGTLPAITEASIDIVGFSAQATLSGIPGAVCLARSTSANRIIYRNDFDFFGRWILWWWIRTALATDDVGASTFCDAFGVEVEIPEEAGTRAVDDGAGEAVDYSLV